MKNLFQLRWDFEIREYEILEENDYCLVVKHVNCERPQPCNEVDKIRIINKESHNLGDLFPTRRAAEKAAVEEAIREYHRAIDNVEAMKRRVEYLRGLYNL